jgi:cAMP-dependent protein kinase regulator
VFVIGKGAVERLLADVARVPEFIISLQQYADLAALPPFAHLDPDQLAELAQHGNWMSAAPGDAVVTEGEPGHAFYVVESGQLDVEESGRWVRTLRPGDHFGEVALLLDTPRTATVRASTPIRAFRLDRAGFDALLADEFRHGRLLSHTPLRQIWDH